nr:FtsX-like permease family protein [Acidobacteriota bacterium]
VYLPYEELPFWSLHLVVRTAGDPRRILLPLRNQLRVVDRDLIVGRGEPMTDVVAAAVAPRRIYARILTAFAALGLALAAVGVFAVSSFVIATRQRELGVRIALGAQRRDLYRTILAHGLRPVAAGVLSGLLGGSLFARLLAGLLFATRPWDPMVFAAVPALLAAVSLAALAGPARNALRTNPVRAIREG